MTKAMYSPEVETQVQMALTQARQSGKAYYDKSARPLAPLRAGQTGTHLLLLQSHVHKAHSMTVWDRNCHRDSGL
ncbi:unnamed protein product [Arctogadus glacialis]